MIRFCDKEVCCVSYEQLDRDGLFRYFIQGNLDETVCVVDYQGVYRGRITYHSLIACDNVTDSILEDQIVLDNDFWKNAGKLFSEYEYNFREHVLLPVVNEERHLISFAYEDWEANRELRMLKELQEASGSLQFVDIYPQYDCVRICGFNELALRFAEYLKYQGTCVETEGELWGKYFKGDHNESLDYRTLTIYAEGVYGKRDKNWTKNLLRSVSAEFECINCIYEANLKEGIIRNTIGSAADFIGYLQKAGKEIVISGVDTKAQDMYDFLMANGISAAYFASDIRKERERLLFGKTVLSGGEVRKRQGKVILLDCHGEYSAFGSRSLENYAYAGFFRNRDLLFVKDYVEIPHNSLKTALMNQSILFVGDAVLCEKAAGYLRESIDAETMVYAEELEPGNIVEGMEMTALKKVRLNDVNKDVICLIAIPELTYAGNLFKSFHERLWKITESLKENNILNYTDYFSYMTSFIEMESAVRIKFRKKQLIPKRFLLGAIEPMCGNIFIKGLLDNHPSILMISDLRFFNNNIFWYCIRLAGCPSEQIPHLFKKMYHSECGSAFLKNEGVFEKKMAELLEPGEKYTSWELFVIFFISYVFMYGRSISCINDMVIYWEPHSVERTKVEDLGKWMYNPDSICCILNVARNICMVNGSQVKGILLKGWKGKENIVQTAVRYPVIEKKDYAGCERYEIRFEDIKLNPRKELSDLCSRLGIPWSETLMETTSYGQKSNYENGTGIVSDFDLGPVYDTYEKYFSEFDRFRISLICAPWQKKYGYPYVGISDFSRRELQEMFLKEFRFEKELSYNGEKGKTDTKIRAQEEIRELLWNVRKVFHRYI